MWDLPGPGLEPVTPALAAGFLTTGPPGKSTFKYFNTLLPFRQEGSLPPPRNLLFRIHLLLGHTFRIPRPQVLLQPGFPDPLHGHLLESFHFATLFGLWFLKSHIFFTLGFHVLWVSLLEYIFK